MFSYVGYETFRMALGAEQEQVLRMVLRNGTALALSDDKDGGLQLFARDTGSFVRVTGPNGRSQTIRP